VKGQQNQYWFLAEWKERTVRSVQGFVVRRDGQLTFNAEIKNTSTIAETSVTHDISVDLTQVIQRQLR